MGTATLATTFARRWAALAAVAHATAACGGHRSKGASLATCTSYDAAAGDAQGSGQEAGFADAGPADEEGGGDGPAGAALDGAAFDGAALDGAALDGAGLDDAAFDGGSDAADDGPSAAYFQIAHGTSQHACAWRGPDLFCWGYNHDGELGIGTQSDLEPPTRVTGLGPIRDVTVGGAFTCALDARGEVYCWGDNSVNELGDGTTERRLVPHLVPGLQGIVMIAAGGSQTCALAQTGKVYCWGNPFAYTASSADPSTPSEASGIDDAVEITASWIGACVRRRTGTVSCWGPNEYGEVGNGKTLVQPLPADVIGLGAAAVQIASASDHACARLADGTAMCWGEDRNGQLGDGLDQSSATPRPLVIPPGESLVELARGTALCARFASGRVACWGSNIVGELGNGGTSGSLVPVLVAGVTDAAEIFGDCLVRASGAVLCWGANHYGQVGDGTRTNRNVPTLVVGLPP
jgi:alpha-tubulin suppressor-like RCC1 family protein